MRFLLIMPPYDLAKSYKLSSFFKIGFLPPLSMGFISYQLKNMGIDVRFIDMQVENISLSKLHKIIKTYNPDIIGLSVLLPFTDAAIHLTQWIKQSFKYIIIVWGGAQATLEPQLAIESGADYVVLGEGEKSIKDLILIIQKKKKHAIGIYSKNYNNTQFSPIERNLNNLGIDWSIYKLKRYKPFPHYYKHKPVISFITSRGCNYAQCKFCFAAKGLKISYRRISPDYTIKQLRYLVDTYKIREIAFWDENFIFNNKWLKEFVKLKNQYLPNLTFSCYARVDTVSYEILSMLADSGCVNIQYGFESGNQSVLDAMNKGITLQQSINAAKWSQQLNIEVRGSFIIGYVNETPEMSLKTIEFAKQLDIDYAFFYPLHIYKGTPLFDIIDIEYELTNVFYTHFLPPGYKSIEDVNKMVKRAYKEFYLRPKLWLKHLKHIKSFEDLYRYMIGFLIFVFLQRQ